MSIVLNLDFIASETLDSKITASGGANGTRVNSLGVIAAATTPRYDYDYTGVALGVLIEEARTNLFTYPSAFDNAAWTKVALNSVTADAATAPDNSSAADMFDFGSAFYPSAFRTVTTSNGAAHALSVFQKAGTTSTTSLELRGASGSAYDAAFTLSGSGTATLNGSAAGSPVASISRFAGGYYRSSVVKTTTNTGPVVIIGRQSGSDHDTVYMWGAQLEAGAFATSYIPATTASVTRSADSLSITGTDFSSWFNATEGTFVIEYDLIPSAMNRALLDVNDSTANEEMSLSVNNGNAPSLVIYDGGVVQVNISNSAISLSTTHRTAFAYKLNDFALCTDGGTVATDTTGTLPTVTRMDIGKALSSLYLNGHVRRIRYDNTRRSDADLQALTVARSGAAAITEGADTVTATGQVKISGTAAIVEGADTATGTGEVGVTIVTPSGRIARGG